MDKDNENKPLEENQSPEGTNGDETTAENAAERLYDESEAWNKSKNSLFLILGVIVVAVAVFYFYEGSVIDEASEQSSQFLAADIDATQAEERFKNFSDEFDEKLGGVARYRSAVLSYKDGRFSEAAATFAQAVNELGELPPRGRALLGQGVSLIKSEKTAEGKVVLEKLVGDSLALPADRSEATYLLATLALREGDDEAFEKHKLSLGSGEGNSTLFKLLTRYQKTKAIVANAESLSVRNAERGDKYLKDNKVREGVVTLDSGLQYEVLVDGNGSIPTRNDEVKVHYHGTLVDGEVFDSSVERGESSTFGVTGVIKGWTEALLLMKVGSKWKLTIPSDLAYGESGSGAIGINEVLVFEVELLGITPKELPKPDEAISDANVSGTLDLNTTSAPDANASAPIVIEDNGSKN
jgi:FKBP-type peptidyl-prolyl cis-trans isomerase